MGEFGHGLSLGDIFQKKDKFFLVTFRYAVIIHVFESSRSV